MDDIGHSYTYAFEPTLIFSPDDAVRTSPVFGPILAFTNHTYAVYFCVGPIDSLSRLDMSHVRDRFCEGLFL